MAWSFPQCYLLLCRNLWRHVSSLFVFIRHASWHHNVQLIIFFPPLFSVCFPLYIFYSWLRREIRRKHWGCCSICTCLLRIVCFILLRLSCMWHLSYFWAAFNWLWITRWVYNEMKRNSHESRKMWSIYVQVIMVYVTKRNKIGLIPIPCHWLSSQQQKGQKSGVCTSLPLTDLML